MKSNFQSFFGPRLVRTAIVCASALITAITAPCAIANEGNARTGSYIDGETSPLIPEMTPAANRALKFDYSATPAPLHIVLPPMGKTERQKQPAANARTVGPLQIGLERDMPSELRSDISPRLEWTALEDGSFVGAVSITSPDASAMRMAIHADLAAGGEIRFFGEYPDQRFPVFTQSDFHLEDGGETGALWSPVVEGDTIGVEITLPSRKALSAFSLSVGAVSHIWYPVDSLLYTPKALNCTNHIDVQCRVGRFPGNTENAVARIAFQRDGRSWLCSGTLLNDSVEGTFIPYFLTAHHCVSTVSVARSVIAFWFYQRRSCGSSELDRRRVQTAGGTDLLATRAAQDSTLLRFRSPLPGGLWFAGSSHARVSHPTRIYGIHHPDGGVKKYSAGRTIRTASWRLIDSGILVVDGYNVDWHEGTTEGGSSGSGLFSGTYLIGVLSGGTSSCLTTLDGYGSFSDFYPLISSYLQSTTPPPPLPPPDDDDHGDTQATATVVRVPSSISGILESYGDEDYFRIDLQESGRLQVQTTGSIDTFGTLFRGGSVVERDDDGGSGSNFRITVPDAQAGTYYIEVEGYLPTATGPYALTVDFSGSSPPARHLPLVMSAANANQQGFVRIINRSNRDGTVRIHAIDDSGTRFGPISLSLSAMNGVNFTSRYLEQRLPEGAGGGLGNWRLELESDLDFDARAYSRTADAIVGIHQVAEAETAAETGAGTTMRYYVPFMNPASNVSRRSLLRLINPGASDARIVIRGRDDRGDAPPNGEVSLTLPAGAARTLSSQQIEQGASGLQGRFGDGEGKWRLSILADHPIQVMSLLHDAGSGHLSNLSR